MLLAGPMHLYVNTRRFGTQTSTFRLQLDDPDNCSTCQAAKGKHIGCELYRELYRKKYCGKPDRCLRMAADDSARSSRYPKGMSKVLTEISCRLKRTT